MARKPRSKKEPTASAALLAALKFVGIAQKDTGAPYQTHCRMTPGFLTATDGILMAGARIEDDLTANPHTRRLIAALQHCGHSLSMTHLPDRLSIKSDAFKAIVPCIADDSLADMTPDAPCGGLDDRLRAALAAVSVLATEGAQRVALASVLLGPGYAVATNNTALFQYWHGLDLPPDIVLPKAAAVAIIKTDKVLKQFGYSKTSFTVYFEDDSWIKTQLFDDKWPEWEKMFSRELPYADIELPQDFEKALDAVQPFCEENNFVYILGNKLCSHNSDKGAEYELPEELDITKALNAKDLRMALPYMQRVDFGANTKQHVHFSNGELRGVLSAVHM